MDMDYTDPNIDYLGRTKNRGKPTPGYHKYYTDEEVWARLSYDNQTFHDDTSYTHVHDRNMISGIPKWTESNRPGSHTRSIDLPRDVPLDEYIPRHPPSKRSRPHQLPRKRSKQSKILLYPITAIILALTLTVVLLVIFLSRQGNATTKGTLNLELRLAGQFYNGMVDSTTSIFKSTENQLCSGAEEAMRSGSTFPHHTTIDCKVDSLRSGSIIATLQVNITGSYAIPDNEHYVQAIESYSTLGSFTVIPWSVVVLSAIYTRDGVETRVTSTTTPATSHISFLLSPSGHLRIDCTVENSPSDWNEIRMMSTDANVGVVATGYENGTIHSDNSTYELSLVAVDSNVSIGLVFPNTTNYSSIRSNYTCQMLRTGNIVAEATDYVTIPDMAINDSITAPGEAITISCNVRYPPSIWEQFNIVSVNSTVIHGRAYPNGTVVGGNSSYTVELQQNSDDDMTLSVIFPNTTTHCTARGSYLCMFSFTGSVIEQSSSVIISDHASGLILDGNNTVEEGERFSVNCSGRLAREGGNLHLYARTKNSSDFVRSVEVPTTLVGDIDDSCYRYITQTYDFLADSDLNGTEFQCVATNDKLTSNQSSRSIDMVVDFAQFNTNFHLQNTTWNPAFADKTSPEFKSFTDKIQDETDFVYSQSILKDNYKKSKVTGLEPGSVIVIIAMFIDVELTINDGLDNQITTILTPTDILTAFTDTLPKVAGNLTDNSPLSSLNSATITIIPGPETVYDCVTKTDVVFLLDASGSIGFENFILMKYFIQNYTAGLWLGPDTIQVSVAKYSNYPNNEFWLNEYHGVSGNQSIAKAINDIQYTGGGTYIESGLNFVMNKSLKATNGARDDASKVIILMTDGIAHDNPATAADVLKREGVIIACVAIGNSIKYDQLQSIAYNDTYIFNATDFNVLAGIATTVKGSSCEISNET